MSMDALIEALRKGAGIDTPSFRTNGQSVIASKVCTVSGKEYAVTVPLEAYVSWRNGAVVQRAFPNLTADQREFLISGNTPAEWEQLFGAEEE